MVDDMNDRGNYESEYSNFMEDERRPGYYQQQALKMIAEKKMNTPLQGTYKSRFDTNKYSDLMESS